MRYDENTAAKNCRPMGKVVDLSEYRRRLAPEQGERQGTPAPEEAGHICVPRAEVLARRSARRRRRALLLDLWASAAVLVMALTFVVRVLFF